MAATDKLRKASGSTRPVVTSLSLPKANGATTADLTSASGWNTATGIDVVMYRRELNTTTGLYQEVLGTRTTWTAQLTGTTLSGMVLQAGTEPASGYAADGNTVVFCGPTAQWNDDVIETLLTLFNQDTSLKAGPIQTALGLGSSALNGWNALGYTFSSVTYNGNRSYDCVVAGQDVTSVLSAGMRLRTTRTVAAPTQSTSLNGTTQYYSKSSPAGMTFTDDFAAGAWVKLSSYAASHIISRYNGTSGWRLSLVADGRIELVGTNAGAANFVQLLSYQSIPLNKWVHITAQLDMSAFTATTTTCYIMIDGVDVPAVVARAGTNPTALVQAGNLEIGTANAGGFFPGKIAQAFVTSAKLTQANAKLIYSQGLTSADMATYSIISAYSFNGTFNDINTTNANNLTANGGAVPTNADSPFGGQGDGTISSTLDYAIVQKTAFATNSTITVQVPEGCTIPTSGGVSSVVYSSNKAPYGMPVQRGKWTVESMLKTAQTQSSPANATWYNIGPQLNVPVGEWQLGYEAAAYLSKAAGTVDVHMTLSTTTSSETDPNYNTRFYAVSVSEILGTGKRERPASLAAVTSYYLLYMNSSGAVGTSLVTVSDATPAIVKAENAYL